MDFRGRMPQGSVLPLSVARSRLGLKQPQGLLLLLVFLGLCHCVLDRPLLKVVATPGRGSGPLVGGVLRCLLQLGPATPTRLSGTQQFPIAKQQIWHQNIYWEVSNPMVPFLDNK